MSQALELNDAHLLRNRELPADSLEVPEGGLEMERFDRYQRLDLVDRHSAETLEAFCRVNSGSNATATRLSNLSALQSFVTSLPLAFADVVSLLFCVFLSSLVVEKFFNIPSPPSHDQAKLLVAFIILPIANLAGLYPGHGLGSVIEFRQVSRALFASVLVIFGIGWLSLQQISFHSVLSTVVLLALALPITMSARFFARHIAKHFSWWGVRTLIIAEPQRALQLFQRMQQSLDQGFRPVGVLLDPAKYWDKESLLSHGIPVFDIRHTDQIAVKQSVTWVIVSPCANREVAPALDPTLTAVPNRILLSSNQLDMGLWDEMFCVGSTTGLRFGGAHPSTFQLALKRTIDLLLTLLVVIVGFPAIVVLCLLVRMSSRGPIFYSQRRVGYGGKEFNAWKFRSMQQNADKVLELYLLSNPAAKQEWERTHKLADDPRVTSIGKLLRATSFDELPQLWNVLWGEMSLVGPRPIIDSPTYDECYVRQYPAEFEAYKTVRPGLTGLWQVRCRNRGVYDLRIYWDMYYIRNWSVWLDLYLIMRTFKTVLLREGAS